MEKRNTFILLKVVLAHSTNLTNLQQWEQAATQNDKIEGLQFNALL